MGGQSLDLKREIALKIRALACLQDRVVETLVHVQPEEDVGSF